MASINPGPFDWGILIGWISWCGITFAVLLGLWFMTERIRKEWAWRRKVRRYWRNHPTYVAEHWQARRTRNGR